ncbi:DUF3263 domain-containing protein (plasmid) [Streptomyces sp. Q6]|uniref:DUF3263 domain-containing protein n=1 Tax=Streptomyces citrinus TaxID=3118173 RepID=A0ACD5AQS1_9ACTN
MPAHPAAAHHRRYAMTMRPDRTRPEGAAIVDLRDELNCIVERRGELPGADVVAAVETWLERFDFTEPEPPTAPALAAPAALTALGLRYLLAVAARNYATRAARDRAIREELGLSPTLYFLLLNAAIDQADALRLAPVTVNRLRRIREAQRTAREERPAP